MTRFSKLQMVNGAPVETDVREIKRSDILKCPNCILVADHYREDGTCKCDDPSEAVMREWGYAWKDGGWR